MKLFTQRIFSVKVVDTKVIQGAVVDGYSATLSVFIHSAQPDVAHTGGQSRNVDQIDISIENEISIDYKHSREKEIVPYAEQEVGIFVTDTLIRKTDGKAIDLLGLLYRHVDGISPLHIMNPILSRLLECHVIDRSGIGTFPFQTIFEAAS